MSFVGSPVPLSLGYVAVSVSFGRSCPCQLPLSKAHFLNLSLDVGKICEGIRAAAWKACRTFRTLVCSLISSNLCGSWHPLNVDLNVWSCLGDVVEVVDYPNGEVLSCWREGPSISRWYLSLGPWPPTFWHSLLPEVYRTAVSYVDFDMFSEVPSLFLVGVPSNQSRAIGATHSL